MDITKYQPSWEYRTVGRLSIVFFIVSRRPEDWRSLSSGVQGGIGTVFGWGHNHRGQLGGVEGSKVKEPTVCEAVSALRPVQIQGGEQTLFCVTGDGKVKHFQHVWRW